LTVWHKVTLFKNDGEPLHEQEWLPDASKPTAFQTTLTSDDLNPGDDLGLMLETLTGAEIFRATIDYAP
jgi:hypothetical protein